ncbi:hypothetical protein INS49_012268 [Diaporthe citri]|uniref:uncharacterized protein n=1 Tax=Diaporthe citri TaxID=83186 RepID=UPI001C7FB5FF|nr:uncharacterized protein INS49_012268 [Diaporthe citri]KAG6358749.1 hypothetical protein INS49_012268 [Diaporthe citri]
MRLTLALAALGLAVEYVAGQQQWQDFGAMPDLLKQPFYDAVARSPSLAKRDGGCDEGEHPCSDVNSTKCCANTHYCIINETDLAVQCCTLGSTCGMTCQPNQFYSQITTTQTTSGSTTVGTAGACIGRKCQSTNYLCPESMGANCCAYGQDCASSGQCLDYGAATSTSSGLAGPTVATMIPSGCSLQGDSTCSVGGAGIATTTGCCGAGYTCAVSSNKAICTSVQPTSSTSGPIPTGSGISIVPQQRGLSAGAKAGIAVGVVIAAALVIGAATWFCIRRRRSGRSTTTGNEMASGINGAGTGTGGGRGSHHLAAAGRFESDDGGLRPYGPSSGPHMSEVDGYAASSSARGGPLPGLTNDYFGPAAASGPYTTPPEHRYGPPGTSPDYLARPVRGEGGTPHGPDDIAAAVEIGSGKKEDKFTPRLPSDQGSELDGSDTNLALRRQQQQQQQQQAARQGTSSPPVRDSIAGRFELYGTDVPVGGGSGAVDTRAPRPLGTPGSELSASELGTPSPMSHEEQQQQQQQSGPKAAG